MEKGLREPRIPLLSSIHLDFADLKMIVPNFFIIGAAKAATTSLSSLLELHPQAAIVQGKEPHFFSYESRYQAGWDKYIKLYDHCHDQKAIGDASTSYSRIRYNPNTINRIKKHVPEAKIIYMVRHPIQRMESAYVEHMCSPNGPAFTSINEAVQKQPMIVDSSRYWEVYDAYRKEFGESRIKIVWFEEYIADTIQVFQDVCRFLEIEPTVIPKLDRQRKNSRQNSPVRLKALGRDKVKVDAVWDNKVRGEILHRIYDDNQRFLAHFGKKPDYWGQLY